MSQARLAAEIHVPPSRVNRFVRGRTSFTVDTALRLSRYFGTGAAFWLNLQSKYDLHLAKERLGAEVEEITPLQKAG